MSRIRRLDPVESFIVGTIGRPGEREFYLQAKYHGAIHSFAIDKSQVIALADRIAMLIGELKAADYRFENVVAVNLEVPLIPEFQIGVIGIVWLGESEQVSLDIQEITEGDNDLDLESKDGPAVFRIMMSPDIANAFIGQSRKVVAAGRAPCPFCGLPIKRMDICVQELMDIEDSFDQLVTGPIEIVGRLVDASNASLFCKVGNVNAIYKPIAGERPLWDFPDGNLAWREVAAYQMSEALKLNCVPPTILREGPFGEGSLQLWIDDCEEVGERYLEKSEELRKIALLDAVINNTDRKIGHLLYKEGQIFGCDHGVTFHQDYKLRTVLWQFADLSLTESERTSLEKLDIDLSNLLTENEIEATQMRVAKLLQENRFPLPPTDWPAIPWPPF